MKRLNLKDQVLVTKNATSGAKLSNVKKRNGHYDGMLLRMCLYESFEENDFAKFILLCMREKSSFKNVSRYDDMPQI